MTSGNEPITAPSSPFFSRSDELSLTIVVHPLPIVAASGTLETPWWSADPDVTCALAGGVNVKLSLSGTSKLIRVYATSIAGDPLPRAYTCTPSGIFVLPSMAIRTEPIREVVSRGESTSS